MSSPRPAQQPLLGVLEPLVHAAGFELDELDVRVAGRRHTVKLVVDADSGVDLDDIARLSRAAAVELDQHEHLIGGSYTLEVTSPGVGRPLTLPRHWRRAHLRLVEVRLREGATLTARVGEAGAHAVTVLADGELRELSYADVAHAAVQVEFRKPPEADVRSLGGTVDNTPADTTEEDTEDSE
jgi:ribosome maturation factor RimP